MRIKNETLFTIACRHPFYADTRCRGLTLRPTGACRKLLRRYDLLFHETVGGAEITYAKKDDFEPLLKALDTPVTFTFALTSTDPHLLNFTDISLPHVSLAEKLFYFSNLRGRSLPDGTLCLHRDPEPPDPEPPDPAVLATDQLAVFPSLFTGTLPKDESPHITRHLAQTIAKTPEAHAQIAKLLDLRKAFRAGTDTFLQIFNQFGKKVWDARLTPGQDYTVDLSSQPPGWYRMTKGKKRTPEDDKITLYQIQDFYASTFPPEQVWGLVEIVVAGSGYDAQIPKAFRLFDDGAIRELNFEIRFKNRATIWRYYVMNPSLDNPPPENATVIGTTKTNGNASGNGNALNNGRGEIAFKGTDAVINGKKIRLFESETTIPLWEAPAAKHTFTFDGRSLPYAGTAWIKTEPNPYDEPNATHKIYSEIFVYL